MRRNLFRLFVWCGIAALFSSHLAAAQGETVAALGSGIAQPLVESLASSPVDFSVTGTSAGIDQFCSGMHDVAAASRPISAAEAAICGSNDLSPGEFLLAHRIVALAADSDAPVDCLRPSELDQLLKPSSSNQPIHWSDFGAEEDETPLTLLLPGEESLEYAILDALVVGDGLRKDAGQVTDAETGAELLAGDENALALLPWTSALATADGIKLLQAGDNCVEATAANVEASLYPLAQSLYLYAHRARLQDNPALNELIANAIDTEARDIIASHGFVPPSDAMREFNATALLDPAAALAVSDGATEFEIPANLSGSVVIAGSANLYTLLDRIGGQLKSANPQFSLALQAVGNEAGIERLCAGETQIALLSVDLASLDLADCAESVSIVDMGAHATALIGNAAEAHTACLTVTQLDAIWNGTASKPETWREVDETMPEKAMTLFAPSMLDRHADLLFPEHATKPPLRRDAEEHYDPLWRAAAVGNVPGALTFMPWSDYLRVLDNGQADIQLAAVDGGAGCVLPDADSIADGSYALSRPAQLLISQSAMADINTQSLLWQLFSNDGWRMIEGDDLVGMSQADLAARRRQLETDFRLAEAAEAEASAENQDDASQDESG